MAAPIPGAARTLAELRPALHFETGHEPPEKRRTIGELLTGAGYGLVGIVLPDGVVEASLEEYVEGRGLFEGLSVANLFALPAAPRN